MPTLHVSVYPVLQGVADISIVCVDSWLQAVADISIVWTVGCRLLLISA